MRSVCHSLAGRQTLSTVGVLEHSKRPMISNSKMNARTARIATEPGKEETVEAQAIPLVNFSTSCGKAPCLSHFLAGFLTIGCQSPTITLRLGQEWKYSNFFITAALTNTFIYPSCRPRGRSRHPILFLPTRPNSCKPVSPPPFSNSALSS